MKPWQQTFCGKTWQDMPGADRERKRMNFALFRRGVISLDDVTIGEDGRSGMQRHAAGTGNVFGRGSEIKKRLAMARRKITLERLREKHEEQTWSMTPRVGVPSASPSASRLPDHMQALPISERQIELKRRYEALPPRYGRAAELLRVSGLGCNRALYRFLKGSGGMTSRRLDQIARGIAAMEKEAAA